MWISWSAGNLTRWCELLRAEGYKEEDEGSTFVRFSPPYGVAWRLDLMLVNAEMFGKLCQAAVPTLLLGVETLVPRAEHLIALKLHALKHGHPERFERDFGDVLALTRNSGLDPQSDACRQIFDQFGTADLYERVLQRLKGPPGPPVPPGAG